MAGYWGPRWGLVAAAAFGAVAAIPYATYAMTHAVMAMRGRQNLKRKYGAKWALVTGSSSGIGYAMAKELVRQDLNVVAVALDEPALDEAVEELRREREGVEVRRVGVDLGSRSGGYIDHIAKATEDIDVQVVVNNAGFVVTGFFDATPREKSMKCVECNAVSAMQVTSVMVDRMLSRNLRGLVAFTSSAAACFPSPFSSLYASTKSFLSFFGGALAVELQPRGIDVCVLHPSPVASRFYDNAHQLDALDAFKRLACSPYRVSDALLRAAGRVTWLDVGPVALGFRLASKAVDIGHLYSLLPRFAHLFPDYKRHLPARAHSSNPSPS